MPSINNEQFENNINEPFLTTLSVEVILHVRGQEVVFVDAHLNITLYSLFVDGDVFLNGCLE